MWWCTCARAGASCVKQIFGGRTWEVLGVFICDVPSRQAKAGVAQDAEGGKVRDVGLGRHHYECIHGQAVPLGQPVLCHARAGDFVVACTGRGLCCGMRGPGTLVCLICCPSHLPSTFVIAICSSSPGIPLSRQLQRDVSSPMPPSQIPRGGSAGSSPSRTPAVVWCVCI